MKTVETMVEIAAPVARVWDVLADFDSYPEWNPFIKSITGQLACREKLSVFIQPPGEKGMRFAPVVLSAQANTELR